LQRFVNLVSKQNNKFSEHTPQESLINTLDLDKKFNEQDVDGLFHWIEQYLTHSVDTKHLQFNNRMWSGGNLPSILGEMTVALKNTSACTYESAPVAVLLEAYMLSQMLDLVGFKNGEGQMTTGSSNANMIAMMIARNLKSQAKTTGLFNQNPLFAFVSEDAHYSFDKAANILGIGSQGLIKVAVDESGKMCHQALEREIIKTIKLGGLPFFIGATLGTTVRGAYDDIASILPIKQKYNCWLHGDGAWGGAVIVNDTLKNKFVPQLHKLDSFTMDFHKMLGSTLMCNFLLINQENLLNKTCANGDTSYIFHDPLDLGINSLQCGRRVDSLKWFLDWKFYQKSGFSNRVAHYYNLAKIAEKIINNSKKLTFVSRRQSFNLCFHYQGSNELNQKIRDTLYQKNKQLLSIAYINTVLVFRLLITHQNMDETTLGKILNTLETTGDNLSQI
jgi:sulfinoalanine decarboxylase